MSKTHYVTIDIHKQGPILETKHFGWAKDPCMVFDGSTWHMYGSGTRAEDGNLLLLYSTALEIAGPWTEQEPIFINQPTCLHMTLL